MIKKRNIAVSILLSIVTFGIYKLYWIACLANDIGNLTKRDEPSGILVLLLGILTFGIYWLYWYYKAGDNLSNLEGGGSDLGVICLVIGILGFGIISIALIQNKVNECADRMYGFQDFR